MQRHWPRGLSALAEAALLELDILQRRSQGLFSVQSQSSIGVNADGWEHVCT